MWVIWVVLEIVGPFWFPILLRHPICRGYQNGTLILGTTHIGLCRRYMGQYEDNVGVLGFGIGLYRVM